MTGHVDTGINDQISFAFQFAHSESKKITHTSNSAYSTWRIMLSTQTSQGTAQQKRNKRFGIWS
jgi:hypothetical protein